MRRVSGSPQKPCGKLWSMKAEPFSSSVKTKLAHKERPKYPIGYAFENDHTSAQE